MARNPRYGKFISLAGAGFQMGFIIYVSSKLGDWLDHKYPNDHEVYATICTLVGVFLAIYVVIKEVIKISKQ